MFVRVCVVIYSGTCYRQGYFQRVTKTIDNACELYLVRYRHISDIGRRMVTTRRFNNR